MSKTTIAAPSRAVSLMNASGSGALADQVGCAHLFEFANCLPPILVDCSGILLQDTRSGMADHLRDEEIRYPSGA